MSRTKQAAKKLRSDWKINLFPSFTVYVCSGRDQEYTGPQVDYYNMEETHLEGKTNSIMAYLTFVQIPIGASATVR